MLPEAVTENFAASAGASGGDDDAMQVETQAPSRAPTPPLVLERVASLGGGGAANEAANGSELTAGMKSFKVLVECPFLVMVLSSYYPQLLQHPAPAPTPAPAAAATAAAAAPPGAEQQQQSAAEQQPAAEQQQPAHPPASFQGLVELAVLGLGLHPPPRAPLVQRALFKEFMTLQIKTLNFLSWSRAQVRLLVGRRDALVTAVVWLLRACPSEFGGIRKELLHSMRCLISAEALREGFLPHVDTLVDERTLEGWPAEAEGEGGSGSGSHTSSSGRPSDALRTAALNMLSELVAPLREKLTLPQLGSVIYLFAKQVLDPTLPLTTQMLSVRLMLHLVDSICRHCTTEEGFKNGRRLLFWILKTLVAKFASLRAYAPKLEAQERIRAMEQDLNDQGALRQLSHPAPGPGGLGGPGGVPGGPGAAPRSRPATPANAGTGTSSATAAAGGGSAASSPMGSPGGGGGGGSGSGASSSLPRKPNPAVVERAERVEAGDSLRTAKEMIMTMMRGLKTVIWCLVSPAQAVARALNKPMPERSQPHTLNDEEKELLASFFQWGLLCLLRVYSRHAGATPQEAKEVFDIFVGALQVMEAQHLRLALGRHLELYFNVMLQDPYFVAIAQGLVAGQKEVPGANIREIAAAVGEALLHFLLRHLECLSAEPAVIDAHANPSVAAALDSTSPAPRRPRPLLVVLPPATAAAAAAAAAGGAASPSPAPSPQAMAATLFRIFSAAITSVAKFTTENST